MKILLLMAFPLAAFAQDMPVPKMFKGMDKQKGQYQVEVLEGGRMPAGKKAPAMTICTDNLLKDSSKGAQPRGEAGCKYRLLKDTADEAVVESVCQERKSTVTMKREGKSMLMSVESAGPKGPQTMKMRYTHLGPCREGQGTFTMDPNSEQCQKVRAQAAKMDPAKQCARQKADRETCEQRVRDAAAQLKAMCG